MKTKNFLQKFLLNDNAAVATEYGLLLSLIVVAGVASFTIFGEIVRICHE